MEISAKYIVYRQFIAASALPENTVAIKGSMTATKETKKHCTLKKTVPWD